MRILVYVFIKELESRVAKGETLQGRIAQVDVKFRNDVSISQCFDLLFR